MVKKPAHQVCPHSSGPVRMTRVYRRDYSQGGKFLPCGWLCPDCKQVKIDPPQSPIDCV